MGKPTAGGSTGGGAIKGTNSNDVLVVKTIASLESNSFDGGGGNDTLDLSALPSGVVVKFDDGLATSKSIVYPDRPFTGYPTDFSLADTSSLRLTGTMRNIENIVGTSHNDYLVVQQAGFVDGGAGNDYLVGRTIIGGTGEDYLNSLRPSAYAAPFTATLIGGTYANGAAIPDHQHDTFEVDGNGVILDFEIGTDTLILPMPAGGFTAVNAATWQDTTYNGAQAASLTLDGYTVTLAGHTADEAKTIKIGLFIGYGSPMTSGPGDDILWGTSAAEQFTFASGSGRDVVTHFTASNDTLAFADPAAVSWSNVDVNGQLALQGSYDGGASTVTLIGFTVSDLPSIHLVAI
jgi:hypothetical protein